MNNKITHETKKTEDKDLSQTKAVIPWYQQNIVILFGIIFCLPAGLILIWLSDWKRDTKIVTSIAAVFWSIIFTTVLITPLLKTTSTTNIDATHQASKDVNQTNRPPVHVFDVPSLISKNISEIRQILGQPIDGQLTDPTPIQAANSSQWDNTFKVQNINLLVTYNPNTGKVIDFFVSNSDVSNKNDLLIKYNLENDDPRYSIKEIKVIGDATKITGYTITPK